ncbi:MAG TPA: BolA family protein [Burkholderiaceae bacterium]|nr:BolA family protein [Burkholderiaceae bacterium]
MNERAALIERRLRERLDAERVEIVDESAQHAGHAGARLGGHFALTVVSPKFNGLNAVQRHRLVYDALDELMRTEIHALSIRALTPGEV